MGDPLPPIRYQLEAPVGLEAIQQGVDALSLRFSAPGDPRIGGIEVRAICEGEETRWRRDLTEISEKEGALFLHLADWSPGCRYRLRFVNSRGDASVESEAVGTMPVAGPLPAPEDLQLRLERERIVATWNPPLAVARDDLEGYLVNSLRLVRRPRYEWTEFTLGRSLEVTVQTVFRRSDPLLVSAPIRATVTPTDRFPPPAPGGLEAVSVSQGVQLVWHAVEAQDLAFYRVYRRSAEDQSFEVVGESVETTTFLDRNAEGRDLFYYVVTALDEEGNESEFSGVVEISLSESSRKP